MNILIIEDEPHTAQLLCDIIEKDRDFIVVKMIDSISDTIVYLNKHHQNIDLIFMDINLTDGHSFEIFKHIDISIPVVFCTSYDEYTMEAIKNNGIDYILKPFQDEEIYKALNKYKHLVNSIQSKISSFSKTLDFKQPTTNYQDSFLTQQQEKSVVVYAKDIALFSIESEVVYIYTFDKKRLPVFKKMEYIESVCDPQLFFRINRQMLVNRSNIRAIEPYFNRKVVLHLNVNAKEKAIVSRMNVSALKRWIEKGR